MRIDSEKCVGCGQCIPYCPVSCITKAGDICVIDEEECVDCSVCRRAEVCPTDALFMPPECFEYPRAIRMQFSDPGVQHPHLKAWGRGTEEAKTNDVVAKFRRGEYGLLLEFGRPCTGTRFTEVEKITVAMQELGIPFIEDNPIFGLLEEDGSGHIKKEYVNEKVLSAIVETKCRAEDLEYILGGLLPVLDNVKTVVSVGLVTRFADDGSLPVIETLKSLGIEVRPNAKINVGLGRPLID